MEIEKANCIYHLHESGAGISTIFFGFQPPVAARNVLCACLFGTVCIHDVYFATVFSGTYNTFSCFPFKKEK